MTLMQRDYVYPEVGDRLSPKEWNEKVGQICRDGANKSSRDSLGAQAFTPFP